MPKKTEQPNDTDKIIDAVENACLEDRCFIEGSIYGAHLMADFIINLLDTPTIGFLLSIDADAVIIPAFRTIVVDYVRRFMETGSLLKDGTKYCPTQDFIDGLRELAVHAGEKGEIINVHFKR